jgi:predicted Zn-dependent peptidase
MIQREILDNGLTLITETMPQLRSVAIGVWLKKGSRHESEALSGVSHFIEHMVFKGTKTRSAERIAAEVDSIGGYMDAFTAKEYASFHLKVLDEHLPLAVEILGDVVQNPLFDPLEMAKEKKVIFEEINMVEDTPDDLVMENFCESFWPDHPLGRPILGTKKTVGGFRRDDLAEYFERVYHPKNIVIAAAGRLDHARTARLVRRHFSGLRRGDGSTKASRPPKAVTRTVARSKRELEQVHLCLGTRALPQGHGERYTGFVLNTVLGGSMSSRLFQNVREKRGLVYSISSGIAAYSDAGLLTIYAGTGLESAPEVIRLTLDELRRLCGERLPEEELRRAKDHIKGGLVLSLESSGSRMSHLARQEIYFGRQTPLDEILEGIEQVSAAHVRRLARQLFRGRVAASVLGNLRGWRPREQDLVV